MILKTQKELLDFIYKRNLYIDFLFQKLNNEGIIITNTTDCFDKIDVIQKFYENNFFENDVNTQDKLRLAFWSLFSILTMERLGGELKIASNSDYCAGTPQLINMIKKVIKNGLELVLTLG